MTELVVLALPVDVLDVVDLYRNQANVFTSA